MAAGVGGPNQWLLIAWPFCFPMRSVPSGSRSLAFLF